MSVNESQNVVLDCQLPDAELKNILKISWTLNETTNFDNSLARLHLNEIQLDQAGVYECYAETNTNQYLTRIALDVLAMPVRVDTKFKKVSATKGTAVLLDCTWWFKTADLFDQDIITKWKINNELINEQVFNKKYQFLDEFKTVVRVNDLELNETGTVYTCLCIMKNYEIKISNFSLNVGGEYNFFRFL